MIVYDEVEHIGRDGKWQCNDTGGVRCDLRLRSCWKSSALESIYGEADRVGKQYQGGLVPAAQLECHRRHTNIISGWAFAWERNVESLYVKSSTIATPVISEDTDGLNGEMETKQIVGGNHRVKDHHIETCKACD